MSERRPPAGPPGDGDLPEGLGALLQPEEHELEALPGPKPAWMERVAMETRPLAAEQARLEARVRRSLAAGQRRLWAPLVMGLSVVAFVLLAVLGVPSQEPILLPVGIMVGVAPDTPVSLSKAVTVSGGLLLTVIERDEDHVETELHHGLGIFEVVPGQPGSALLVRMGSLSLATRGARLQLERRGEEVELAVLQGTASLRWPSGEVGLSAGERWSGSTERNEALSGGPVAPEDPVARVVLPGEDVVPEGVHEGQEAPSAPHGDPDPLGTAASPLPGEAAPDGQAGPVAAAPGEAAQAARAWLEVVNAQEAGASPEALLLQVDAFLAAWPDSALASEAALLRLELWSVHHDPHAAIAILEHWLATHPADDRRPQVLLLHGSVAAGRLQDCARARPSLLVLAEGEAGELQGLAMSWLAACDGAPEP